MEPRQQDLTLFVVQHVSARCRERGGCRLTPLTYLSKFTARLNLVPSFTSEVNDMARKLKRKTEEEKAIRRDELYKNS